MHSPLTETQTTRLVWTLLAIYPLIGMGVDLIAPSLPALSQDLSASPSFSKNLISIYLFGFALFTLIAGTSLNTTGRKVWILGGLLVFTLASLMAGLFSHEFTLFLARFLQGAAVGSASTTVRVILTDILPKSILMRIAATMTMLWGIGPIIGPVIGSYLQAHIHWKANFYFFAAYGFLLFIFAKRYLRETLIQKKPWHFLSILKSLNVVLKDRYFMGLILIMAMTYSSIIAFVSIGAFLFETEFHYSVTTFGNIALLMGFAFFAGTLICKRLIPIFSSEILLQYGIYGLVFISASSSILFYFFDQAIIALIILNFLFLILVGIVYPSSMGKALAAFHGENSASSSALMSFLNLSITGTTALVLSFIHPKTVFMPFFVLLILSSVSFVLYQACVRHVKV